jgi:hypothetical protein
MTKSKRQSVTGLVTKKCPTINYKLTLFVKRRISAYPGEKRQNKREKIDKNTVKNFSITREKNGCFYTGKTYTKIPLE